MKKTSTITSILLTGMFLFSSLTNYASAQQCNTAPTAPVATTQKAAYIAHEGALMNLADSKNGGEIVTGTNEALAGLFDGNTKDYIKVTGCELVMGFKGNRAAIVEQVGCWIGGTLNDNIKDFEVYYSSESPSSGFKLAGKFTTQNLRMFKNPYQQFNFSPVRAKFIKLKFLSAHNDGNYYGYEFQILGRFAE